MTFEEPLDLEAVAADDAVVERLRRSLSPESAVVWGDDDDDSEDLSYALLHALQSDVNAGLPTATPPSAEVVPLASRRRAFGRTAGVAVMTAGVLSIGGVAAAATSNPGDALYGVRSAVSSAVHEVVDAITPSNTVGPSQPTAVATPTATITPRGELVSDAAHSAAAQRQIEERLATAGRLLDNGQLKAAGQLLDQADRRLTQVADPAVRAQLGEQIALLRARAARLSAAEPTAQPGKSQPPASTQPGNGPSAKAEHRATPRPSPSPAAHSGSHASVRPEPPRSSPKASPKGLSDLPGSARYQHERPDPDARGVNAH